jgi:hypothetical protein
VTPAELLAEARRLAGPAGAALGTTAPRASALLARTALERSIWGLYPQLDGVTGRPLVLLLPRLLKAPGNTAALAWGRLSAASHHHVYDLPPTDAELALLLHDVERVIEHIDARRARRAAG